MYQSQCQTYASNAKVAASSGRIPTATAIVDYGKQLKKQEIQDHWDVTNGLRLYFLLLRLQSHEYLVQIQAISKYLESRGKSPINECIKLD